MKYLLAFTMICAAVLAQAETAPTEKDALLWMLVDTSGGYGVRSDNLLTLAQCVADMEENAPREAATAGYEKNFCVDMQNGKVVDLKRGRDLLRQQTY